MQTTDRALHRFAQLTASATFLLVFAGGLVTSTGSGLAVPDWPLSYGMLFPPMVGGIFYEHGHRMVAGVVAILTTILALWLRLREPRRWVRRLGGAAVGVVLSQALLGGITVLFLLPTPISVAHAGLAMIFFSLVSSLALFTSDTWRGDRPSTQRDLGGLRRLACLTTALLYLQILIGALMRHSGAGLAIPDFPLAFGQLVPPLDSRAVQIHFAHRIGAVMAGSAVIVLLARVLRDHREDPRLKRPAWLLAFLFVLQLLLGALTIWTAKAVSPTTFHVAVGGLMLVTSLRLTFQAYRIQDASQRLGPIPLAVAEQVRA